MRTRRERRNFKATRVFLLTVEMFPTFSHDYNDYINMFIIQVKSTLVHGIYEVSGVSYVTLLFLVLVSFIVTLAIFSGLLYNVSIVTGASPYNKLVFAYKYVRGDSQIAHSLLTDYKYLAPDLPRIVINYTRLHYKKELKKQETFAVGMVISVNDNPAWLGHIQVLKDYEFSFHELPGINHAILTEFPYRNYLSMCLASIRVLPRIKAYIKKHHLCAHPVMELIRNDMIEYVVPMSFQFDYYSFFFHATPDRSSSVPQQLRITPSSPSSVNAISICSTN
ncbi:hypothetical protein B566_EDAN009222 [Ephemera danica]|nr:hypothetical protein B566_EDAN009222 [Ephemera danica]